MSAGSIGSLTLDLLVNDRGMDLSRVERTMTGVRDKMARVGTAARNMLIVGGGALAGMVVAAAKFESRMSKVETLLGADAGQFMPGFKKGVSDLSVEFGES